MARVPIRKLTIADGMIMIAATAVGLAMTQWIIGIEWAYHWRFFVMWSSPIVGCLTAAVLALRFRRPRPCLHRLMRQPGAASGVVSLTVLAIWTVIMMLHSAEVGYSWRWEYVSVSVGPAVMGTWIVSFLTRTSRPEASGIDRLGRLLGVGWILEMLVEIYDIYYGI